MSRAATSEALFVAEVPLDAARDDGARLLELCFQPDERRRLARRHPRSTAGDLAAKRALCDLALDRFPGCRPRERDFLLDRTELGAPYVRSVDPGIPLDPDQLAISITHTRRRALGLAVFRGGPSKETQGER